MSSTQIPEYWLAHIAQWKASGLSRAAYSAQHGFKLHTLAYWIKRNKTLSCSDMPLTLIAAKIQPAPQVLPTDLILRCPNGSVLHLPPSTPATWLGTLLSQLK